MASLSIHDLSARSADHPICSACNIKMWLVRIEKAASLETGQLCRFECQVCGIAKVVPSTMR